MFDFEYANYIESELVRYRNNPLIETESIYSVLTKPKSDLYRAIAYRPLYDEAERQLPTELRLAAVQAATEFFQPFQKHWDLAQRLFRAIGQGYVYRNPAEIGYFPSIDSRVRNFLDGFNQQKSNHPRPKTTTLGFNSLGITGSGKSTSFQMILGLLSKPIIHKSYKGSDFHHTQIPVIYLECPHDGSLRGLFFDFFFAVDDLVGTGYYRKYSRNGKASVDEMLPHFARVILVHSIGILVIDEINRLVDAITNAPKMFSLIGATINRVRMPIVQIGTYKALPLFSTELSLVRRGAGQGDMIWEPLQEGSNWVLLLTEAWRYQYTCIPTPLTPELMHTLHVESQGIIDFAIKMYMLSQIRAILKGGDEQITEEIIRTVAFEDFRMARPLLNALKQGDYSALAALSDVQPVNLQNYIEQTLRVIELEKPRKPSDTNSDNTASPNDADAETFKDRDESATAKKSAQKRSPKPEPLVNGFLSIVSPKERDPKVVYTAMEQAGYIAHPNEFM